MSDSMFHQDAADRQRGLKSVQCKGTFGSGSVTSSGYGLTITRSTNGTYTLTTDDSFTALHDVRIHFNAVSATPVDLVPQGYADYDTSAKTYKFKLLTGTVATDPSANAVVYCTLTFRDTSVTP